MLQVRKVAPDLKEFPALQANAAQRDHWALRGLPERQEPRDQQDPQATPVKLGRLGDLVIRAFRGTQDQLVTQGRQDRPGK